MIKNLCGLYRYQDHREGVERLPSSWEVGAKLPQEGQPRAHMCSRSPEKSVGLKGQSGQGEAPGVGRGQMDVVVKGAGFTKSSQGVIGALTTVLPCLREISTPEVSASTCFYQLSI